MQCKDCIWYQDGHCKDPSCQYFGDALQPTFNKCIQFEYNLTRFYPDPMLPLGNMGNYE